MGAAAQPAAAGGRPPRLRALPRPPAGDGARAAGRRGRVHRPGGRRGALRLLPARRRLPVPLRARGLLRAAAGGDALRPAGRSPTTRAPCARRCTAAGCCCRTRARSWWPSSLDRVTHGGDLRRAVLASQARAIAEIRATDFGALLRERLRPVLEARAPAPAAARHEDRPVGPRAAPRGRDRRLGAPDARRLPLLGPHGRRLRPRAGRRPRGRRPALRRLGAGRGRRRRDPALRPALAAVRRFPRAPGPARAAAPQHHAARVLRRLGRRDGAHLPDRPRGAGRTRRRPPTSAWPTASTTGASSRRWARSAPACCRSTSTSRATASRRTRCCCACSRTGSPTCCSSAAWRRTSGRTT